MRKCPCSVSNPLWRGSGTFNQRGKAGESRSSQAKRCISRDIWKKKEKSERRKRSVLSRGISRVCLCPMTSLEKKSSNSAPMQIVFVLVEYAPLPWCSVCCSESQRWWWCVCVCAVLRDGGLERAQSNYLCGPARGQWGMCVMLSTGSFHLIEFTT